MSQSDPLRAYLPHRLQHLLQRPPAPAPAPPWEERSEAAVLFMDVSGFTALSEALTRQDHSGSEQLTEILNAFYERMVATIEQAGGYVVKFSGDAITAIFPALQDRDALADALHCGLEQINIAHRLPTTVVEGQDFPLRVKVGVSEGPLYTAGVGSYEGELRYMVAGRPVQEASRATTFCAAGELMVPAQLEQRLPDDVTSLSAPGGHLSVMLALLRRGSSTTSQRFSRRTPLQEEDIPVRQAGRFVPALIFERVELGLSHYVAEHRPVSVLFCEFTGIEFDQPDVGVQLQQFLDAVFRWVAHFGGTIDKVEQADKGNVVMALFGAPRALERHEEAAVGCALRLKQEFAGSVGARIHRCGINSGLVYAGHVGAPWRCDYTVMGDVVNLAARLMTSALEGEIRISARVQSRLDGWGVGSPQTQIFKGKTEPITSYAALSTPEDTLDEEDEVIELPNRGEKLVGRETELEVLERSIDRLRSGQPSLVLLEGEVGVGKSCLASYVIGRIFDFGRVLQPRHRQVTGLPYGFWRYPLLEVLGGDEDLAQALTERVTRLDPSGLAWLSVFNPLLELELPETETSRAAEQRQRERRMMELATLLILDFARNTPTLIVLEDFHEADSSSMALLRLLSSRIKEEPLLLLVVARPNASLSVLEGAPGYTRLSLQPLNRTQLEHFLHELSRSEIDPSLTELVWQHSQGNPLFAEELWIMLNQRGQLQREGTRLTVDSQRLELPDSLRAVLQARLDTLSEVSRAILKLASTAGNRFSLAMLGALRGEEMSPGELQIQLDSLVTARILVPAAQKEIYEFRHVLSRDVIYNSLTRSQQAEMHRRIGEWLERMDAQVGPEMLAFHFEQAGDMERAIRYHLEAAIRAEKAFANQEALAGFEKVLNLAEEFWKPLPHGVTRVQLLETMADIHFRIGASSQAVALYRRIRNSATDWLTSVRCLRKEADARCRQDDVPNALRCANEALVLLRGERGWSFFSVTLPMIYRFLSDLVRPPPERIGPPVSEEERPRLVELDLVYAVMALALYYEGSRQIMEVIHRMCELALRLGEPGRIARAYATISFLYASLGFFKLSERYSDAAIQWLERADNQAAALQMRGTITYALAGASRRIAADWPRAQALLERSISLNQSIGDIWEEGLGLMNLAIMWRVRGHHLKALEQHKRILSIGSQSDQHLYMGEALVCDGLVLAELGRFEEAQARIDKALSLAGVNMLARVRAIGHRAWLKYLQGKPQAALFDMREAVRLIQRKRLSGEHVAEVLVWWVEILVASQASSWEIQWAFLRAGRTAVRLPSMRGCLLLARGIHAAQKGRHAAAALLFGQAAEQLQKLGRLREAARALRWQASVQKGRATTLHAEAARLLAQCGLPEQLPGAP